MTSVGGGPAFPVHVSREEYRDGEFRPVVRVEGGMSLRDYFAARALGGLCAGQPWPGMKDGPEMALRAYLFADAMLEAREK